MQRRDKTVSNIHPPSVRHVAYSICIFFFFVKCKTRHSILKKVFPGCFLGSLTKKGIKRMIVFFLKKAVLSVINSRLLSLVQFLLFFFLCLSVCLFRGLPVCSLLFFLVSFNFFPLLSRSIFFFVFILKGACTGAHTFQSLSSIFFVKWRD